jgi:sugar-specific transcriptional regulator TrmB
MRKDLLEDVGLNKNEAIIYRTLLENGEMLPSELTEKTPVMRQNVYAVLKSLVKKGLIEQIEHRKKLVYRAEHPQKLLDFVESQKAEIQKNENLVESMIPEMISDFNLAQNKPGVVYYEGLEGIKRYMKIH